MGEFRQPMAIRQGEHLRHFVFRTAHAIEGRELPLTLDGA